MTTGAGAGLVRSRRALPHERARNGFIRYVAVAVTPRGVRGESVGLTRKGAERNARAVALASERALHTVRARPW